MRCDSKQCELDLALYGIQDVDEEYVYLSKKKVKRSILVDVSANYPDDGAIPLNSFFMPKEAALIMVRRMFIYFYKRSIPMADGGADFSYQKFWAMARLVETEWGNLLSPEYDSSWFLGGLKADVWEQEFRETMNGRESVAKHIDSFKKYTQRKTLHEQ